VSFDDIRTGAVVRYPYLWAHQSDGGETEGRKDRPVAVGVRLPRPNNEDVVLLFPITSQEPTASRFVAEIPLTEKRRAGLATHMRLWLVLDEYNQDILGQSFYWQPEPPLGYLSKAFLLPLLKAFIARRARTKRVKRNP
jgi:hypothetical protein